MQLMKSYECHDRLLRHVLTGVTVVAMFVAAPAALADEIFVQFPGIKGESQVMEYKEAIEASSWQWGMDQPGTMHMATGGGAGKVNVQNFTFTKFIDMTSPVLMRYCASGRPMKSARISLRHPGAKAPYMVIDLEGVLVASISTSGDRASGRASESVSLNFATVRLSYSKDGRSADTQFGWSIVENKAL